MAAGVPFDADNYPPLAFLQTLFLVQAWFPTNEVIHWSGPSWSLSAEWFAYLLFPAYAWLALRLRARPWALLALGTAGFVAIDALYIQAFGKVLPRAEDSLASSGSPLSS